LRRVIGHFDLDYFYAQVEEIENPSLRTRPILICVFSGRSEESGVISTANYTARQLGIKSGMPISVAKRKLAGRGASFIPMEHQKYETVSERIRGIAKENVDVLEPSGIDEAFFDITQRSGGDYAKARSVVTALKNQIRSLEGLTCSVGIGPNKVVAKIASDFDKPNGLTVITPDETRAFLEPLQVEKLYGVGPKTAQALKSMGVERIGQLATQRLESLEKRFGPRIARYLHDAANGINDEPVIEGREATQLSRIVTLKKNTKDPRQIFEELSSAISDVHAKLLGQDRSFRTLSLVAVFSDLSTRTKTETLGTPTRDIETLRSHLKVLIRELTTSTEKELRRAGVRLADLTDVADQSSLVAYLE